MGKILKVLSEAKLQPNSICPKRFVIEACESIHVHDGNIRLVYGHDAFCKVLTAFKQIKTLPPPKADGYEVVGRGEGEVNSSFAIELCENRWQPYSEYVHIHYRNLRIELPIEEFLQLVTLMEAARGVLLEAE